LQRRVTITATVSTGFSIAASLMSLVACKALHCRDHLLERAPRQIPRWCVLSQCSDGSERFGERLRSHEIRVRKKSERCVRRLDPVVRLVGRAAVALHEEYPADLDSFRRRSIEMHRLKEAPHCSLEISMRRGDPVPSVFTNVGPCFRSQRNAPRTGNSFSIDDHRQVVAMKSPAALPQAGCKR